VYSTTVVTDPVAQHDPTVPNPGPRGVVYSNHLGVETTSRGPGRDEHGYLVDTAKRLRATVRDEAAATHDATA